MLYILICMEGLDGLGIDVDIGSKFEVLSCCCAAVHTISESSRIKQGKSRQKIIKCVLCILDPFLGEAIVIDVDQM